MKVGDLVTLSTYGSRVKRTGWVYKEDVGIVKEIKFSGSWTGYAIHWMKSNYSSARRGAGAFSGNTRGSTWEWENWFGRKDLKFAKKKG